MNELTINLDIQSKVPLYEQIYEYIKHEIQDHRLHKNDRLPSTRRLAEYLEVSRSTVTLAYEQLLSEGYIDNQPYRGYYVNELDGLYRQPPMIKTDGQQTLHNTTEYMWDFSPSGVDLTNFPYNTWRKLSKDLLLNNEQGLFNAGDPQGEKHLRETIASYLSQARGVRCAAEQVVVGAGNDYLLMLLQAILGRRYRIGFENPTYKKAADILEILGNTICPVSMDRYGMDVSSLEEERADIAYVMPSHQYPLGIVMPVHRRMQLLSWAAAQPGRYIIEDDYDSEFRYKGKPIPALQGYDSDEKVIYIGTFSKSIAPAIRISFLVLPRHLLARYETVGKKFASTVPRMDQEILHQFIRKGYFERHLNRMRSIYKGRHDALLDALRELQDVCDVLGEQAGTHVLLKMRNGMSEEEAVLAAKDKHIRIYGLSSYRICIAEGVNDTVLLGYANLTEGRIREAVSILKACWRKGSHELL